MSGWAVLLLDHNITLRFDSLVEKATLHLGSVGLLRLVLGAVANVLTAASLGIPIVGVILVL